MSRNVVLVCGGRTFFSMDDVQGTLDALHAVTPITCVVHGAAPGADELAARWARSRGVPSVGYHADWQRDGKAAGPIRNEWMLRDAQPELVVAFTGGKGTAHMTRIAKAAGVEVLQVSDSASVAATPKGEQTDN